MTNKTAVKVEKKNTRWRRVADLRKYVISLPALRLSPLQVSILSF